MQRPGAAVWGGWGTAFPEPRVDFHSVALWLVRLAGPEPQVNSTWSRSSLFSGSTFGFLHFFSFILMLIYAIFLYFIHRYKLAIIFYLRDGRTKEN